MQISVVSYSLTQDPATFIEWKNKLVDEILSFVNAGSSVILYPELFLMGLAKYLTCKAEEELDKVSAFIFSDVLPFLQQVLVGKNILLILGSGPRAQSGKMFNSCPIWYKDSWHFQDKLYLTPWEREFTAGEKLNVFEFNGLKCSVVICFDSEQPDVSLKLKGEGVDLLLVPSATTNRNGNERVNRCASARSIELGAVVVTSPLVGDCVVDLIDHNEGRQGFFLPAQESIVVEQEQYSTYSKSDPVVMSYVFDEILIKELKQISSETKPFLKEINESLSIIKI